MWGGERHRPGVAHLPCAARLPRAPPDDVGPHLEVVDHHRGQGGRRVEQTAVDNQDADLPGLHACMWRGGRGTNGWEEGMRKGVGGPQPVEARGSRSPPGCVPPALHQAAGPLSPKPPQTPGCRRWVAGCWDGPQPDCSSHAHVPHMAADPTQLPYRLLALSPKLPHTRLQAPPPSPLRSIASHLSS